MNILVLGSGGREHALTRQLANSLRCQNIYVAPGNAGTAQIAQNISLAVDDFETVKKHLLQYDIDMLVVGPEKPLVKGIYEYIKTDDALKHIDVIGPSKKGALLEGSKQRAKEFMNTYNIPTAAFESFTVESLEAGKDFLKELNPPYVLKADGLAGGKGVLIIDDVKDAQNELENMLTGAKFGEASKTVVIEEFLDGVELSVFALTDGQSYKILPTAKDYKRIGEGDTGLNTGGMGAISPAVFADKTFMGKVEERIVKPTIEGLQSENIGYHGFLFFGLMNVEGDPYVIEYNVRMGDPETEVVLPRVQNDLVDLFKHVSQERLDKIQMKVDSRHAATIMAVSGGYPKSYEKGKEISGLDTIKNSILFHAGTRLGEDKFLTNGGRVLAVTAFGKDYKTALQTAYNEIEKISFDKMYYRKDLGEDLKALD